jgi:hypothetical protein
VMHEAVRLRLGVIEYVGTVPGQKQSTDYSF